MNSKFYLISKNMNFNFFEIKEELKKSGTKWDHKMKRWYVEDQETLKKVQTISGFYPVTLSNMHNQVEDNVFISNLKLKFKNDIDRVTTTLTSDDIDQILTNRIFILNLLEFKYKKLFKNNSLEICYVEHSYLNALCKAAEKANAFDLEVYSFFSGAKYSIPIFALKGYLSKLKFKI